MTKVKLAFAGLVAAAALTAPLIMQHQSQLRRLREETQSLRQQINQMGQLAAENDRLSNIVAKAGTVAGLPEIQFRELLTLRGEVGRLREENKEIAVLEGQVQELDASLSSFLRRVATGIDPNTGLPLASERPPTPLFIRAIKIDTNSLIGIRGLLPAASGKTDNEALRQFFALHGVKLEPPESLYYNSRESTAVVRATLTNLSSVETLLQDTQFTDGK